MTLPSVRFTVARIPGAGNSAPEWASAIRCAVAAAVGVAAGFCVAVNLLTPLGAEAIQPLATQLQQLVAFVVAQFLAAHQGVGALLAAGDVDRDAIDDDTLLFRREGGGWPRLNKLFGGELDGVLQQFQREVWAA